MPFLLRNAFEWGEKDYHKGWALEHNPYSDRGLRKMWEKGFKKAKGRTWLLKRSQLAPDSHLGAVAG